MKLTKQRIFIKNLPETATQNEIEKIFSHYGKVLSIEIKERKKDANLKNLSLFFSYVNIEIDDHNLQKCFQDFNNEQWHGQYVELQIAKESFLEKLKREREESGQNGNPPINQNNLNVPAPTISKPINGVKKKSVSSSSSSSSSESEEEQEKIKTLVKVTPKPEESSSESESSSSDEEVEPEDKLDLVIKNNKYKKIDKNGLKIESVGKQPIHVIEQKKKSKAANSESLKKMQQEYLGRQSAIKAALSSIDQQPKNKIIFDDELPVKNLEKREITEKKTAKTNQLFQDEEESDQETYDFSVKTQFEGAKGQKLLELQSKFKNDNRFKLDERFLDEEMDEPKENETTEDLSLEEEKRREYEILEQVLGKKIAPSTTTKTEPKKMGMVRYDPSLPEHSKYELKTPETTTTTTKRKRKEKSDENIIEPNQPEVSKEVFYNVSENLKDTFQEEKEGFSLLKMFGRSEESPEEEVQNEERPTILTKKIKLATDSNPFRYDSSDDEEVEEKPQEKQIQQAPIQVKMWTEPFFFTKDDFRLQEGHDFVLKMAEKRRTGEDFGKLRREIKQVAKGKVKNIQRKNKPFKKKLGGNKRKKIIRMKKAMKR